MSVLVEGFSVIVRRSTLDATYPGGTEQYSIDCPNRTFCADDKLTRVGFTNTEDVTLWIERLEARGLEHLKDGSSIDIAIVSPDEGFLGWCDWLDGGMGSDGIGQLWLKGTERGDLATPVHWSPKSGGMVYLPVADERRVLDLGPVDGMREILDMETGRTLYLTRASAPTDTRSTDPPLTNKSVSINPTQNAPGQAPSEHGVVEHAVRTMADELGRALGQAEAEGKTEAEKFAVFDRLRHEHERQVWNSLSPLARAFVRINDWKYGLLILAAVAFGIAVRSCIGSG